MKITKQKILTCAIRLFNDQGLVNVRLQHIADEAKISVGNLAYHYYSKQAIVQAIDEQLEDEITPILAIDQNFPSLIDFDNHLSSYYYLLKQFAFYFLDVLEIERAYPKIHFKRKEYIQLMIQQIRKWMLINVEKGILKKEKQQNQHEHTALTIWMIITFWLTQQQVRGKVEENEGNFKEVVWNQLLNQLTKSGFTEYEIIILPQLRQYTN